MKYLPPIEQVLRVVALALACVVLFQLATH